MTKRCSSESRSHYANGRIEADLVATIRKVVKQDRTKTRKVVKQDRTKTRKVVKQDRTKTRALSDLAQQQRDINAGLHTLLLQIVALDGEKHARLLQFVAHRLESRARTEQMRAKWYAGDVPCDVAAGIPTGTPPGSCQPR